MFLLGRVYFCYGYSYFVFCVFRLSYCSVVRTSAIDCLERLVSEMIYYVSSGTLNHTYSLILFILPVCIVVKCLNTSIKRHQWISVALFLSTSALSQDKMTFIALPAILIVFQTLLVVVQLWVFNVVIST